MTLPRPHKRTCIRQFKFCESGTQIYLQHEEAGNIGIYCLSALPARLRGSENLRRVQHFRNHNRVSHRGENPRSRCQSGGYRNLDHIRRQWTFRPHRYPSRDLQARVFLPRVRGQETGLHGEGRHRVAYHQDESELIGPQWSNRYGRKGQGWPEHVHEVRKQRPGTSPDEQCNRHLRPPSGRQDGQSGPHLRQPHFSPQRRTRLRQCLIRNRPRSGRSPGREQCILRTDDRLRNKKHLHRERLLHRSHLRSPVSRVWRSGQRNGQNKYQERPHPAQCHILRQSPDISGFSIERH